MTRKTDALRSSVAEKIENGELHGTVTGIQKGWYGVLGRMTYQATDFGGITWHGSKVDFTTSYADGELNYDAYVNVPANATMRMPDSITVLENESLRGTAAHRFVFSNKLKTIGQNVFPNTYFIIEAPEGSKAYQYAVDNCIPWQKRK